MHSAPPLTGLTPSTTTALPSLDRPASNTVGRKVRQQLAEEKTARLADPKAKGIMAMLEKELAQDLFIGS